MTQDSFKTRVSRQQIGRLISELTTLAEGQTKPVKLPAERHLAQQYRLSRRAIRTAIDLLEKRNLVIRRHGSGNFLVSRNVSFTTASLILSKNHEKIDRRRSEWVGRLILEARKRQVHLVPVFFDEAKVINPSLPAILIDAIPPESLEKLTKALPAVVAMGDFQAELCCRVCFDRLGAGREAAGSMAKLGHRRTVILAGSDREANRQPVEGFYGEASALGLNIHQREGSATWQGGYRMMRDFLSRQDAGHRFSAVFACNDRMAGGACQSILQAGLKIPQDVSVIGCGDEPLADELEPPLTTFRFDEDQLIRQTFSCLEQSWRMQLPQKVILSATLIRRASLGPARPDRWERSF